MTRIEVVCLLCALGILAILLQLVRSRQLREEYALLWIAAALSMIVLSLDRQVLYAVARLLGVYYPPIVLPAIFGFFGMLVAVHFSLVISRLADQNRVLAQELALLKLHVYELKRQPPPPDQAL